MSALGLAMSAARGVRHGVESRMLDVFTAGFADAEGACVDALERMVDVMHLRRRRRLDGAQYFVVFQHDGRIRGIARQRFARAREVGLHPVYSVLELAAAGDQP